VTDGLVDGRCWWGASTPEYVAYHDEEWGRPVRDDRALFEKLSLEAFQSGLSWLTILRKRESFRAAFAGFEIERVAAFGDADVERLLADAGIVPAARPRPRTVADIPASTPESAAMAKELKRRGFRFVGPTTAYAMMQACGLVDDHIAGCLVTASRGSASSSAPS
jgi:DNA-3-methyladenine glycosylase I